MTKILTLNTDGSFLEVNPPTVSAGAGSAGLIPALGSTGALDISFMPTGIGADVQVMIASEALAAGAFVNVYNNGGVTTVRNALAADNTKPAKGFVLSAVPTSGQATVYVRGLNNLVPLTGLNAFSTGSNVFLSPTVIGEATSAIPTTTGSIAQVIGTVEAIGSSTATVNFSENIWTVRA